MDAGKKSQQTQNTKVLDPLTTTYSNPNIKLFSPSWNSIGEILEWRAMHQPFKIAYRYIQNSNFSEKIINYQELDIWAKKIASEILKFCEKGDRAILFYQSDIEFIKSFFGCIYAGIIPVPAYPPKLNKPNEKLNKIIKDCLPKIALTTDEILSKIKSKTILPSELESIQIIQTTYLSNSYLEKIHLANIEEIAFLQYTSGSTSDPKGVIVTHKNILINEEMIKKASNHDENSSILGWLPMFHDMGLISNVMQALYCGIPHTQFSATDFLKTPSLWLKAITKYKATTSGGPNFAYDLCCQKISAAEKKTIDLSFWKSAYNGSEPIQYSTIKKFSHSFANCGFKESSFLPCYGLAEATLYATGNQSPKFFFETETKKWLVSSGTIQDNLVKIINPKTLIECKKNELGEIWLSGDHITKGYWENPKKTEESYIKKDKMTFLRTGDLGFTNSNQELFITSRLKDLIIINGKNYYPHDLEKTAIESVPVIEALSTAVFIVNQNGRDILILVSELKRHHDPISYNKTCLEIAKNIHCKHEIMPFDILLLKPYSLPKTSSGKLQRQLYTTLYANNEFKIVYQWLSDKTTLSNHKNIESLGLIEKKILGFWQTILAKKNITIHDNFFVLGGTSLNILELVEKIETEFQIQISENALFECQTIDEQACLTKNLIKTYTLDKNKNLSLIKP